MTVTQIETILGFGFPGGYEWIILLILGLLIFGRRLPEVGRSLGKSIVEFKKGMKEVKTDINDATKVDSDVPRRIEHKPDSNQSGSNGATGEAKLPEESESSTPH